MYSYRRAFSSDQSGLAGAVPRWVDGRMRLIVVAAAAREAETSTAVDEIVRVSCPTADRSSAARTSPAASTIITVEPMSRVTTLYLHV